MYDRTFLPLTLNTFTKYFLFSLWWFSFSLPIQHFRYDVSSAIPDGSIQRAGENILALLREVAHSPSLSNPSAEDRHGKIVFFDILGLMGVVYSERVAMVMNFGLLFVVLFLLFVEIDWSAQSSYPGESTNQNLWCDLGIYLADMLARIYLGYFTSVKPPNVNTFGTRF